MLGGAVMLGLIIRIVITLALFPIILELFLVHFIPHVPIIHINGFGGLGIQIFCYKTVGRCVICLDWSGRLRVPHHTKLTRATTNTDVPTMYVS